ncbi:hypothetical protein [Jeotgalibacillus sp. JSM ZJ347]|uniref:hypothetical protein n=1 Tax=Jeotgalibacillus sp. JSM ZJ347 TaxID=3342117 RepID=UPI0035A92C2C
MTAEFEFIRSLKNMNFTGLYSDRLLIYKDNKSEFHMNATTALLGFRRLEEYVEETYLHIEWDEDFETGHDFLVIKEQTAPEPLEYKEINEPQQKYLISASSYLSAHDIVKNVWAYGYSEEYGSQRHTIVLEFEDSFFKIQATPATDYRIVKEFPKPSIYDVILLSTEHRKELDQHEGS